MTRAEFESKLSEHGISMAGQFSDYADQYSFRHDEKLCTFIIEITEHAKDAGFQFSDGHLLDVISQKCSLIAAHDGAL